jgi:hypothetical protein
LISKREALRRDETIRKIDQRYRQIDRRLPHKQITKRSLHTWMGAEQRRQG